jgi:hypothetical protein
MRTSNKILLATFLVAVLIVTGIQVALYAKIKNGDLVVFRNAEPPASLERFETPNIKKVLVIGMEECRINYSDAARIELPKNWKQHLKWRVNGDSLVIEGNNDRNYVMGERVYLPIEISLPGDVMLHARYANLFIRGAGDSTTAFSRSVSTENSHVFVIANDRDGAPVYWKKLVIASNMGEVTVSSGAEIGDMELTLNNNTVFSDEGAKFGSLSAIIDNTSKVSLHAGSLEKIKLIKQ